MDEDLERLSREELLDEDQAIAARHPQASG